MARAVKRVDKIKEEQKNLKITMPELALKFGLSHPAVSTVLAGLKIMEIAAMKKVDFLIAESLELIPKKNLLVLKEHYEHALKLYKKLPYKKKSEYYKKILDLYNQIKNLHK